MPRSRWLIALPFLAVALVLVAMLAWNHQPTPVRMDIDELLSTTASERPTRIAVIGTVQPESRHQQGDDDWSFTLQDDDRALPVHYTGVVPVTFEDGARVLVVGRLNDGTFSATSLAVAVPM
jgi:cytochrome c-type biogenesis protein CcmE